MDILLAILPWVAFVIVVLVIFGSCVKIVPQSREIGRASCRERVSPYV